MLHTRPVLSDDGSHGPTEQSAPELNWLELIALFLRLDFYGEGLTKRIMKIIDRVQTFETKRAEQI
jgi:hypothetical protein